MIKQRYSVVIAGILLGLSQDRFHHGKQGGVRQYDDSLELKLELQLEKNNHLQSHMEGLASNNPHGSHFSVMSRVERKLPCQDCLLIKNSCCRMFSKSVDEFRRSAERV